MTTNVYAAKRAMFARLREEAEPGRPLDGWQVEYAWPGNEATLQCIYGAGTRFSQADAVGERGTLVAEVALISVYIRLVKRPAEPVEDIEIEIEQVVAELGKTLRKNPNLGGVFTWNSMNEGEAHHSRTDDETVCILALQLAVGSMFGYDQ